MSQLEMMTQLPYYRNIPTIPAIVVLDFIGGRELWTGELLLDRSSYIYATRDHKPPFALSASMEAGARQSRYFFARIGFFFPHYTITPSKCTI